MKKKVLEPTNKYSINDQKVIVNKRSEQPLLADDLETKLLVSSSPHTFSSSTTTKIMRDVLIALLPASIASIVLFGFRALLVILVCVISSVLFEFLFQKLLKHPDTIKDLSAAVTGLLLALNLPASVPLWQAVIGCLVAIVVVKGLFGGIGKNFANPAIAARIIMLLAFTSSVTAVCNPIDVTASATPLASLNQGALKVDMLDMLLGVRGGALGETCTLALIIGFIYLLVRKVISWHTPVVYIGTVFVLMLLLHKDLDIALCQTMAGGLFIGAIFMATDYTTSPFRPLGKVIFAFGCGLITFAIRAWGSYPEGVSFSILFMNLLTPYINKWVRKMPFGGAK